MKSFFKNIHLWLSLPFGIIFSIICLTGAILVFEKEITALVNPSYDSHVSLGIYVTIFLLLMALTGLTWSFGWYRDIAYGMFADLMETSELRRLFYSLHTGSWGGIITKTIYFISALIGGILPWTGYYLWFKKTSFR